MVRIIVDSACDLRKEDADRLNLDFLPLKTIFGNEEFLDGIDLTREEFYTKLENSSVNPTTSQISPADFEDVYEDVKKNGDTAVVITISSKLSGTYQSANIAREDYEDCVYVVDSLNATVGEQLLVLYACQLREQGASAKEIADALEQKKGDICLAAVLDTLEYLQRGGRISKTVAVAGTLLSIKPLVAVEDGEVASIGNARGLKNAGTQLTKALQERGEIDFSMPCAWVYSGHSDELLQKYIEGNADAWDAQVKDIPVTGIGSTIGTHVGPGAFGLAFFRK
ncbi:MAG: DegV family protein [Roseburia sp.]|nr:DegV family protein [Roseburia sp.]